MRSKMNVPRRILGGLVLVLALFLVAGGLAAQEAPLVPRTLLLAFDWSGAPGLAEGGRFVAAQGLKAALAERSKLLFVVEAPPATGRNDWWALADQADLETILIVRARTLQNQDLVLGLEVWDQETRRQVHSAATDPLIPDPRWRNLGPGWFTPPVETLDPWIQALQESASLVVVGVPGSRIRGSKVDLTLMEAETSVIEGTSGTSRRVTITLDGHFSRQEDVLIEVLPAGKTQTFDATLEPYGSPGFLDIGLLWMSFPGATWYQPWHMDRLYWGIGANFYGIGIREGSSDPKDQKVLYPDLHLLEAGAGVLWFPLGRHIPLIPSLGADAHLRFDLESPLILDLLNPLSAQFKVGVDLPMSQHLSLHLDAMTRYTLSLDATLAFGTPTTSNDNNKGDIPRPSVLGPGIIHPVVPYLGVRWQP